MGIILLAALPSMAFGQSKTPAKTQYSFRADDWPQYALPLLEDSSLQKELKVTAEQKAGLVQVRKAMNDDPLSKGIGAAQDQARAGGKQAVFTGGEPARLHNRYGLQALDLLDEEQKKRIEQIVLQIRFKTDLLEVFVFPNEAIKTKLMFSSEQKEKLQKIVMDCKAAIQSSNAKLNKKPGSGPADFASANAKLRKEASDKFLATFSADQKAAWKELLGTSIGALPKNITFTAAR